MAAITYNKASSLGSMVSSLVNGTVQMKFLSTRLKEIIDEASQIEKYTTIETLFELPPGQGQSFYVIITDIYNKLNGITRIAALDQG
jgi:hypothetical protein